MEAKNYDLRVKFEFEKIYKLRLEYHWNTHCTKTWYNLNSNQLSKAGIILYKTKLVLTANWKIAEIAKTICLKYHK